MLPLRCSTTQKKKKNLRLGRVFGFGFNAPWWYMLCCVQYNINKGTIVYMSEVAERNEIICRSTSVALKMQTS